MVPYVGIWAWLLDWASCGHGLGLGVVCPGWLVCVGTRICILSAKKKIGFGGSSLEVEVCVAGCFADSAKVLFSRAGPICSFEVSSCCCVSAPGTQKNL